MQIKDVLKNFLHRTLNKFRKAGIFLKKMGLKITRFLYHSRKTILLVTAVALATLISSFLVTLWFSNNDYAPNGEYDRTLPTTGTIKVQGLEIYGGDTKYDPEHDTIYVDWGDLGLGVSKSVAFYVKSTSNVDIELLLNVTNWMPAGIDDYITVSWDYNGTLLSPTHEILVAITLKVASNGDFIDFLIENEVTAFGFDITIFASGV